MEFFIEKQLIIMLNSVILGLIFGAFYDIIKISHIICGMASYSGENRGMKQGVLPCILFALMDFVFVSVVSVTLSVFIYWQNNGVVRAFILIPCIVGFVLYHNTIGCVVMYFSEAVVRLIRLVFRYTVAIPVRFVVRIICRAARIVYVATLGRIIFMSAERIDGMRTARYLKDLECGIRFDRLPKKRRKEKK